MKNKNIRVRLCMVKRYLHDKAKERMRAPKNLFYKIYNMLITLWSERAKIFKIVLGKYTYLKQVELVLTTQCSLRCKDCANLMQYYKKTYAIDKDIIVNSINKIQKCFDEINTVVLVGGEPFLYKEISEIINYIIVFSNINHIDIFTNGTIVPAENNISALRNSKVRILVSDYGKISSKKDELEMFCKKNNINYYIKKEDLQWGYVGDMTSRERSNKQLKKQFRKCNNYCRSILNGKLFYCPRAAHGDDLKLVNTKRTEYVDFRENVSIEDVLKIVYSSHFFSACNYCNYGTKEMVSVVPGIQVKNFENKIL